MNMAVKYELKYLEFEVPTTVVMTNTVSRDINAI
jgi:hypothetical protein